LREEAWRTVVIVVIERRRRLLMALMFTEVPMLEGSIRPAVNVKGRKSPGDGKRRRRKQANPMADDSRPQGPDYGQTVTRRQLKPPFGGRSQSGRFGIIGWVAP
jgi:hypothetical protein